MAETADYDPGDWKGYNFKSAQAAYKADAGRGYQEAVRTGVEVSDLVPKFIETQARRPLIVIFDVTGSMDEWPAIAFGKLPYLDKECPSYLGDDMEISFFAVGDAHPHMRLDRADKYFLQVRPFTSGTDLKVQLDELKREKGGGGDAMESYEMAALYCNQNVRTPNAVAEKPIVIFVGDEGLHSEVFMEQAKDVHLGDGMSRSRIPTDEIMKELVDKFSVFIIRKTYGDTQEDRIQAQWVGYLGADRVKNLEDPSRVVDTIFGCLAQETGRLGYFKTEMEGRQTADQCAVVFRSLKTEHFVDAAGSGKSRMLLPGDVKKSRLAPKSTNLTDFWDDVDPKPAAKPPSSKSGKAKK